MVVSVGSPTSKVEDGGHYFIPYPVCLYAMGIRKGGQAERSIGNGNEDPMLMKSTLTLTESGELDDKCWRRLCNGMYHDFSLAMPFVDGYLNV